MSIVNKPSLIEHAVRINGKDRTLRFLIMDAPKDENLHLYIKECKKLNVKNIARISEPCYDKAEAEAAGISVHELYFEDGAPPPEPVINKWLSLVNAVFDSSSPNNNFTAVNNADGSSNESPCIAVHCVAGLGRAPVLVAIALIEHGMDAISAVTFIRQKRRGAINAIQLGYLENYVPKKKLAPKGCGCAIM